MSSTDSAETSREVLERLLDAVFYAPVGLLLSTDSSPSELASQGRQHLEAARVLGRIALSHPSRPPEANVDAAEPQPG